MTRRERILTALVGGVPDRPPISFDSHGDSLAGVLRHYGRATRTASTRRRASTVQRVGVERGHGALRR